MHSALLFRLLLTFALLFAQQGGMTHSLSHALAEQNSDQTLAHHTHCDLCEIYAQMSGTIGSSSINLSATPNSAIAAPAPFTSFFSNSFNAFAARAPPDSF